MGSMHGAHPAMAMPGMDERHGPASTATRWAVIGAFGIVMLAALAAAVIVRCRPAVRKRRDALARVRASHLALQGGERS